VLKFDEARDELLLTLEKGGMTRDEARRKLRAWTLRIETRHEKYLERREQRANGAAKSR
jgi:hypothetical protein